MVVIWAACGYDKFRANFKQKLFHKWIKKHRPMLRLVFHAKISVRFQFEWFRLCPSACRKWISPNFRGPQTSPFSTIFVNILGIILFYVNKSTWLRLVNLPGWLTWGGFENKIFSFDQLWSDGNPEIMHNSLPCAFLWHCSSADIP